MSFARRMQLRQRDWARRNGLAEFLEDAPSRAHVLRHAERHRNLHDPTLWMLIEGKEHMWARALTSSQCFAVNLFGPLVGDPHLARAAFVELCPERPLSDGAEVQVRLEFTPEQGPDWLGEKAQPTQVDAAFLISEGGTAIGYWLIEVKLAETGFGECRGSKPRRATGSSNPDPTRCDYYNLVRSNPQANCWLAADHGRTYWSWLLDESWFDLSGVRDDHGCPFRDGLYQVMRNVVLARALTQRGSADWADVAVCVHPENRSAHLLKRPVLEESSVLPAMRRIAPSANLRELDPREVIAVVGGLDSRLSVWASWMRGRYDLTD